jgi:pimeloyl-ACP methyl ester carboxylesterase
MILNDAVGGSAEAPALASSRNDCTSSYQPRREPWHEDLEVRGLRHRLTWWGEPSDSPIVLLHGFMDSGEAWQFLVDCLPESWSCVAPDWRGFGRTEWPAGGYWFPDYLADLEALLDALAPRGPARVIGHSMGGNIATLYAGIRPQRLAWLVNLEGFGPLRTTADCTPERYETWLDQCKKTPCASRYKSLSSFAAALRVRNPRLTRAKAEFIARAWTRPVDSGIELAADPRHQLAAPAVHSREEVEACWRRVEIPVLLLMGQHSDRRPQLGSDATDERFRSIFRDARLGTLPGVGHMLHHEDPETVARHIQEFAAETAARGADSKGLSSDPPSDQSGALWPDGPCSAVNC